jgi:hypothetical protein
MTTLAVDAIPQNIQKQFLKEAYAINTFWGDMLLLCNELGLRNIEARELQAENVDLNSGQLKLSDSKQVRAYITKTANKAVDAHWLIEGRKFLRQNISDPMVSIIVRLPTDTKQLANLAEEYDLTKEFEKARDSHYKANIDEARAMASKTAPKGRTVDFSRNKKVKNILTKRIDKYGEICGYLFPVKELGSNRANSFEPVSRQTVNRVISVIREKVESISNKFREALRGIRTGLHSFRKSAVQRVAEVMGDVLAASIWVGHGNGSGDLSTTQNYLNKSKRRMDEINEKLSTFAINS